MTKTLYARIPAPLYDALKARAEASDVSLVHLVIRLLGDAIGWSP